MRRKIVVVVKGYPRLSETFIAQELLGLEQAGLELAIASLRRPTDDKRHPVHDAIRAPVFYLPEYLHEEPVRVLGPACLARAPGFWRALGAFAARPARDFTPQPVPAVRPGARACPRMAEGGGWLHAHFIHTPASATRYASLITGIPWTCSAHAKDIWTSPDWELAEKLASARWTVTCTAAGFEHLKALAPGRATPPQLPRPRPGALRRILPANVQQPTARIRSGRCRMLSVGRAVEKKGFDILLKALALLPADLHWRFEPYRRRRVAGRLGAQAAELGIADRISW